MSFFISTNTSALRAGASLAFNIRAQNDSMDPLSSGKRVINTSGGSGAVAASLMLNSETNRVDGAIGNFLNAVSYLEVHGGALQTASMMIERMHELKSIATQDPSGNQQDKECYYNEFDDLQGQLYQISQTDFNEVSLFAKYNKESPFFKEFWFISDHEDWVHCEPNSSWAHTQTIYTSASGSSGSKISIYKLLLLSALTTDDHYFEETFNANATELASVPHRVANTGNADANGDESISFIVRFSVDPNHEHPFFREMLNLADVFVAVFVKALEIISFRSPHIRGVHSWLSVNIHSLTQQITHMSSALCLMVDIDIAEEITSLAKYSILPSPQHRCWLRPIKIQTSL